METAERILAVAADMLEDGGAAGLTTRAVCGAAKVTAPTLYHHFGDKEGLLRAVVERGLKEFFDLKRSMMPSSDPIEDLKHGWYGWIHFALERPNLFRLMTDVIGSDPSAIRPGYEMLRSVIERIADERRLLTDADTATRTIWAASHGVMILFLQGARPNEIQVSSEIMIEALIARLVGTQ